MNNFNEYVYNSSTSAQATASDPEFYGRAYFEDRIINMSEDLKISPTYYKEVLRALLSGLRLSYVDDQGDYKEVKLHHGRQERNIAKLFQENNLVLPYSTVFQSAVSEDPEKRRSWSVLQKSSVWDDESQRALRVLSYPDLPVKIEYTFSVWAKYLSHLDQLSATLRMRFNPHKNLDIAGTHILKAFLKSEEDVSKTDVGDKEDRIIRKNFTIEVQGYLSSPRFLLTHTGKITKINSDFWI